MSNIYYILAEHHNKNIITFNMYTFISVCYRKGMMKSEAPMWTFLKSLSAVTFHEFACSLIE